MISFTPLPKWKNLLSLKKTTTTQINDTNAIWGNEGSYSYSFSRLTWSILSVVKWIKKIKKTDNLNIWFPDYFCNSVIVPISEEGVKIVFYPIAENLVPDWDRCNKMVAVSKPDLFILVHYFGIPSDSTAAEKFCNISNCILFEDASHVLNPITKIGTVGQFVGYSHHKVLPLPDGASLILNIKKIKKWSDLSRNKIIESFNEICSNLPQLAPPFYLWAIKRTLQMILPTSLLGNFRYKTKSFPIQQTVSVYPCQPRVSSLSKKLFSYNSRTINNIATKRKEITESLNYIIENKGIKNEWYNKLSDKVLYLFPLKTNNKEDAQELFNWFKNNKIPVSSWPDLPPEVIANPNSHKTAIHLNNTVLFLPNHHTLSTFEISQLLKVDPACGLNKWDNEYDFKWNKFSYQEWERVFYSINKSNLLQSWDYGEAKSKTQGWSVLRSIIYNKVKPIGVVQVLIKKYPVFGRIARINRGPLFVDKVTYKTELHIYKLLGKELSKHNIRILFIAPEINFSDHARIGLKLLGYSKIKKQSWRSSWLDLSLSNEVLRQKLNGKWRNQLKSSEKANLEFKVSGLKDDLVWLTNKYLVFQKQKKFEGIPISILNFFRDKSNRKDQVYTTFAQKDGIPIAGLIIIKHGIACTYVVGWNDKIGRSFYATNFLLWKSIIEMKKIGCKWFDLGGLNEDLYYDITRFKNGLGGCKYKLIGEYIKY
jgi:dTDP-4-amino-4,6-dideoxygalactose transaminase